MNLVVAALPGGDDNEDETSDETESDATSDQPLDDVVKRLVDNRYNEESAKAVLDRFEKLGIRNEEDLKKYFGSVSLPSLSGQGVDIGFKFVIAFGAFNLQTLLQFTEADPVVKQPLSFLLGAVGFTVSLEAIWSLLLLLGAVGTTVIWQTNPKAFLDSVKALAGEEQWPGKGLGVVDRAADLARAVKVGQTLLDLQEALGEELAASADGSTLDRLGAVLTLSNAKATYGFDPVKLGMEPEEALKLARAFAKYDKGGVGELNADDLEDMSRDLDMKLSSEEAKEALQMLDGNDNGKIEFDEFVSWYARKMELQCDPDDGCKQAW